MELLVLHYNYEDLVPRACLSLFILKTRPGNEAKIAILTKCLRRYLTQSYNQRELNKKAKLIIQMRGNTTAIMDPVFMDKVGGECTELKLLIDHLPRLPCSLYSFFGVMLYEAFLRRR